jgi:hypothetical protein
MELHPDGILERAFPCATTRQLIRAVCITWSRGPGGALNAQYFLRNALNPRVPIKSPGYSITPSALRIVAMTLAHALNHKETCLDTLEYEWGLKYMTEGYSGLTIRVPEINSKDF